MPRRALHHGNYLYEKYTSVLFFQGSSQSTITCGLIVNSVFLRVEGFHFSFGRQNFGDL